MAESFKFELVSPERLLVSEEVESVVIPGSEGEMTVMANHAPVMTTVKPGIVTVKTAAGADERYVVFGGFADILPAAARCSPNRRSSASAVDKADIVRRIEVVREEASNAKDHFGRTRAEEMLHHLAALQDAV